MRTFKTVRTNDVSGVSGVGVVAEGVQFTDGTVALRWLTETASTALYNSIDDLIQIHGHGGSTTVQWDDTNYYHEMKVYVPDGVDQNIIADKVTTTITNHTKHPADKFRS